MKVSASLALLIGLLAACVTQPKPTTDAGRDALHDAVLRTIREFKSKDKKIGEFFDDAHAYVVFPDVFKVGLLFGGARGDGEVYERGSLIGWAGMSQISLGAQIGGKEFAQVVFFETKEQFTRFKSGKMRFGAGVDAVAADSHAGLTTGYSGGVAVFVWSRNGLMADASGSGQKFTFVPQ